MLPGMAEEVEEFRWLLEGLDDRRAIAVDLRGRGPSDAPQEHYSWEDHIADLAAVHEQAGLGEVAGLTISRGTGYMLGFALGRPDIVRGVLVGDYFARHVGFPGMEEKMAERHKGLLIRGRSTLERMPPHAIEGVFRDAVDVLLYDRLPEVNGPVWVVRGTRDSRIVTDEVAEQWRTGRPDAVIRTIEGAGHDLWSRDPDTFLGIVREYLAAADAAAGR